MKLRHCPDTACHEVELAGGIADIFRDGTVTEIQTASLFPVQKKLRRYFENGVENVTVIFPLIRRKWICRTDPETGEVTRRKSPKTGKPWDALYELSHIVPFLCDPRLHLVMEEVDVDEYCAQKNARGRSPRIDRIPLAFGEQLTLDRTADFAVMIPETLGQTFTAKDYSRATNQRARRTGASLYVLCAVGILEKKKEGRTVLYRRRCAK